MNSQPYFYPSGEFAKLAGVNKRTLHYYNDIGLFCPQIVGENGYHYYSCFQFAQLELILTLRKVGLSIEEIREYVKGSPGESFAQMLEQRKKLIDESIDQLLTVRAFLEQKSQRMHLGANVRHGAIELCTLPQRRIICSRPISGKYDESDFSIAAEFSLRLKRLFHLYDSFGSRIRVEALHAGDFNQYDTFFAYAPDTAEECDEILPAGQYLRAFCVGKWSLLPQIYRSILDYAQDHDLILSDCAYEEGLNEMALNTHSDYVTMITIPCSPKAP